MVTAFTESHGKRLYTVNFEQDMAPPQIDSLVKQQLEELVVDLS
jgi:hypothetical protein